MGADAALCGWADAGPVGATDAVGILLGQPWGYQQGAHHRRGLLLAGGVVWSWREVGSLVWKKGERGRKEKVDLKGSEGVKTIEFLVTSTSIYYTGRVRSPVFPLKFEVNATKVS